MKKKNTTWLLSAVGIAATTLLMNACGSPSTANGEETSATAQSSATATPETSMNADEKDKHFMEEATSLCLEQIDLGNLAIQKSNMAEVKELGALMVKDHGKMLSELKDLSVKKSIVLPTAISETNKREYNTLSEKYGQDFDKLYCDKMVRKHKEAVTSFEKAAEHGVDIDIKAWANTNLPMMRNHVDQSISCQKKCEKSVL